jgi:hypothetical protein
VELTSPELRANIAVHDGPRLLGTWPFGLDA